jgi:hypothetical protein
MLKKVLTVLAILFLILPFIPNIRNPISGYAVSDFSSLDLTVLSLLFGVFLLSFTWSNLKRDLFVFISGSLFGLMVEWYGISRGIWSYPNGEQLPPLLMIISWGFVSLIIVHFSLIFNFIEQKEEHVIRKWLKKKKLLK